MESLLLIVPSNTFFITHARASVTQPCSVNTLRHCYTTHHLEDGTDLVYLKNQLGLESIKTPAKYMHVCATRQRPINHPKDSMALSFRQITH